MKEGVKLRIGEKSYFINLYDPIRNLSFAKNHRPTKTHLKKQPDILGLLIDKHYAKTDNSFSNIYEKCLHSIRG